MTTTLKLGMRPDADAKAGMRPDADAKAGMRPDADVKLGMRPDADVKLGMRPDADVKLSMRPDAADWRWAATIGTLMNCRGVTELVVLGIGRQIGVITPQLFTILVLMAMVTTAATAPLLNRLNRADPRMSAPLPYREPAQLGSPAPDDRKATK